MESHLAYMLDLHHTLASTSTACLSILSNLVSFLLELHAPNTKAVCRLHNVLHNTILASLTGGAYLLRSINKLTLRSMF